MTDDDNDDGDEDWADVEQEWSYDGGEEVEVACPECRSKIYQFVDKCPKCGYWLTAADRRKLRPGESRPAWQSLTAVIIILAFLICLLMGGFAIF